MDSSLRFRRRAVPASLSTKNHDRFYPTKTVVQRHRVSQATEFYDTDIEDSDSDEESLRRSMQSLGYDSNTTLSTPELPTPDVVPRNMPTVQLDKGLVAGPSGPHLFRDSRGSSIYAPSTAEIDLYFERSPLQSDFSKSMENANQLAVPRDAPYQFLFSPKTPKALPKVHPDVSQVTEEEIRCWSPDDVARWLKTAGYNQIKVIDKFIINDITGRVLLDLEDESLKQIGIASFGNRYELMISINHLRATMLKGTVPEPMSRFQSETTSSNGRSSPEHFLHDQFAPHQVASESSVSKRGSPKRRSYTMSVSPSGEVISSYFHGDSGNQIAHGDNVSIVAIEEEIPKLHSCSKGEKCRKFKKSQQLLERLRNPDVNSHGAAYQQGSTLFGNPGNPDTARNLLRPISDAEASIVASSDIFGPQSGPRLSEAALSEVQRVDPQETIRNFLQHQHVPDYPKPGNLALDTHNLPPANELEDVSPPNVQPSSMAEHLRCLPKLTIPTSPNTEDMTTAVTTNRYFTPTHQNGSPTAVQQFGPFSDVHHAQAFETYRQGTPFSEMDAPITAIPSDPIARDTSQSVPPSMQYGTVFPPYRANSVARSTSSRSRDAPPLRRVNENKPLTPIEGPADLIRSPRMVQHGDNGSLSALASDPDVTHAGYMKKRKTTRLLRHEWSDAHFTLRGTNLAMHKDESEAHRVSRALDNIDVDEYAVACSSLATSSKLTAAFKRSILRNGNHTADTRDGTAFAFSLVPATRENERKALFSNNGVKSHHFAVKSREQRIDWMRELMLAKALKKGRDSGDDILVNGNMI